ncbi:nucleotidyltransferase family protein [Chitinophagaceae bacterium LB-8]|uniref:Nucleotidyltransferase family protein n=1 Tax=Paraflavisolibacter caeni TaxID=2982496 RepID=A0A9X2Y015_9BACT|nr:nucleotidyltransferase family protein [Paraflavisolibacter caeni]MCU7552040.1 nucleotidyltransferase family protein [Paraflavisolibacter caeni]
MKAMIFAAGLGTRFKPWTDNHPKALALVHGKTLLQRNIEYLQSYGIKDVVVNVHHFADQIINAIKENDGWGSHVTISDETDEVLETGGGLLKAKELLSNEPFLTINVDILTDLNLHQFAEFHQNTKALITLAVSNRDTSRYLLFDDSARLCGWWNNKTKVEKIAIRRENYIQKAYSGIALFDPQIFDLIPFTGKFSLIDVYLALAAQYPIMYFDHTGSKFIDVGKPESVADAENLYQQ